MANTYTEEFKAAAAEGKQSAPEASKNLGIRESTLCKWIDQLKTSDQKDSKSIKVDDELKRLRSKESRYFCDSLFWASQPKQAAKDYATVILLRKPRYPWHNIVPTQQGDRDIVPIVDAAYR